MKSSPLGFRYRTSSQAEGVYTTFWYEKNLFGDVIGVYSEDGVKLVSYAYNAWGKVTTTLHADINWVHPATLNPFLYRGYYYDSRFMMYYLETRWYDPMTCRFISPDGVGYLGANRDIQSNNLYLYCSNNPVMFKDDNGTDAILITDYGDDGLPIVGHSILFLQDENGLWHMTQFAGNRNDKSSAKVYFDGYSTVDGKTTTFKYYSSDYMTGFTEDELTALLNTYYPKESSDRVYIQGDFTASVKKARQYAESNNFGAYNLFTHNCCHYVQAILEEGTAYDSRINAILKTYSYTIPRSCSFVLYFNTQEGNIRYKRMLSTFVLLMVISEVFKK